MCIISHIETKGKSVVTTHRVLQQLNNLVYILMKAYSNRSSWLMFVIRSVLNQPKVVNINLGIFA